MKGESTHPTTPYARVTYCVNLSTEEGGREYCTLRRYQLTRQRYQVVFCLAGRCKEMKKKKQRQRQKILRKKQKNYRSKKQETDYKKTSKSYEFSFSASTIYTLNIPHTKSFSYIFFELNLDNLQITKVYEDSFIT